MAQIKFKLLFHFRVHLGGRLKVRVNENGFDIERRALKIQMIKQNPYLEDGDHPRYRIRSDRIR